MKWIALPVKENIDLIRTYFKSNNISIYIIDPYPHHIKYLIQESTKSQNVFALPFFWDKLSKSIIEIVDKFKIKKCHQLPYYVDAIMKRYYYHEYNSE